MEYTMKNIETSLDIATNQVSNCNNTVTNNTKHTSEVRDKLKEDISAKDKLISK